MIKFLLIIFLAICAYGMYDRADKVFAAEEQNMTMQQVDHLLSSEKFKCVRSKSKIPKIWWKAMGLNEMSDVGGPFSGGCTGPDPHSRMITGAISKGYAVLISECGGFCYYTQFRLFKREQNAIKCLYSEMIREPRLSELCKKLQNH